MSQSMLTAYCQGRTSWTQISSFTHSAGVEKWALDSVAFAHPCRAKSAPSYEWPWTCMGLIEWWVEHRVNFRHQLPHWHKLSNRIWQPLSTLTSWIATCVNLRKFYHLSLCFLVYKLNKIVSAFLRIVGQVKKKLPVSRACAWHIVGREGVFVFIAVGAIIVLLLISRAMRSGFTSESLRIHSLTQARFLLHPVFFSLWISQAAFF